MLTPGSWNWTAEQHEAAAAALGHRAENALYVIARCTADFDSGEDGTFGKGLLTGYQQLAIALTETAFSHALAAEKEREKQAQHLSAETIDDLMVISPLGAAPLGSIDGEPILTRTRLDFGTGKVTVETFDPDAAVQPTETDDDPTLTVICAWCKEHMRGPARKNSLRISHGCCDRCTSVQLGLLDA